MTVNNVDYDDLTVIRNIGPARQQWLREVLQVRTYQDLAALAPETIESQLQVEGRTVAYSDIEMWRARAQELAAAAGRTNASTAPAIEGRAQVEPTPTRAGDDWQPLASFAVEFQARMIAEQQEIYRTTVHHIENDTDQQWPGVDSEHLCAWMLSQAGDRLLSGTAANIAATGTALSTAMRVPVTVTQVRVYQPLHATVPSAMGEANQPLQGIINGEQPFALEAWFALPEPVATHLAQQITYTAQFSVRSRPSRMSNHLGNTASAGLTAGQAVYAARLPQAKLDVGIYRLQVMVSLNTQPPSTGYLEIPFLHVA